MEDVLIPDLNRCYLGDILEIPSSWPDAFVQAIITSPPYLWIRDYQVPPSAWPEITYAPMPGIPPITIPAQVACLGLEDSPAAFVAHIVHIFRGIRRILRDDGVLFFNMGDKHFGSPGAAGARGKSSQLGDRSVMDAQEEGAHAIPVRTMAQARALGLKEKDLIGVPWRCAFALQADGWYLRMDNIWHKPNPMPDSAQDRTSKAHEYFFQFSKSEDYYFDGIAIREQDSGRTSGNTFQGRQGTAEYQAVSGGEGSGEWMPGGGRNKRSVWTVASFPYKGSHYATFPPNLIKPAILASTPEAGCCSACRRPWLRIVSKEFKPQADVSQEKAGRGHGDTKPADEMNRWDGSQRGTVEIKTIGWKQQCECPRAHAIPSIVFDPFCGSGTTGEVCQELGRAWLGCDLDPRNQILQDQRTQKIGLL